MADDKSMTGKPDRELISLNDPTSCRVGARSWACPSTNCRWPLRR